MPPARLPSKTLEDHLVLESPATRRLVRALRRIVLATAPEAAEAIKFHVLCYYHDDSFLKSIGGNICLIEIRKGGVVLSFIHGAALPDPAGWLTGSGKHKRFLAIPDVAAASRSGVRTMIRAAAKLRPWD